MKTTVLATDFSSSANRAAHFAEQLACNKNAIYSCPNLTIDPVRFTRI
ncbi:hypothetical protein [Spirosoma flavum]|uniref:Universal stress protein n=1 Tax=Spirosoma flavum TaxID=2048557 RepID=A0ABW6AUZ8_9BACT